MSLSVWHGLGLWGCGVLRVSQEEALLTCDEWHVRLRLPVGAVVHFVFEARGQELVSAQHAIVQHRLFVCI